MNILVTTPKSEIDTSRKEGQMVEQEGGYWFRTFKFKPKVEPGDKIFFTNGFIKGYGIIFEVSQADEEGEQCELTGRIWSGNWIVKYHDWHWLHTHIPFKGFQGIRYIDRMPELKDKLMEVE